jgi:arylsulfatase A-like enzyme|tara:strand:+ start:1097 stop:1264 length:168 start_codon:yes stop_codon:yes gene_type:complete
MNVLWIMADQLRWDYLSCYGAEHIDIKTSLLPTCYWDREEAEEGGVSLPSHINTK